MKVLIVDGDMMRTAELKLALTGGAEVTVASSASFALTMLERNRHDVVVSRARIDDMGGHELCAILKSDPNTRDVRFVLVAGDDEVTAAQTTAAEVDLVLPPSLDAGAVLPLVTRLIQGDVGPAPALAAPEPVAEAIPAPVAPQEPPPAQVVAAMAPAPTPLALDRTREPTPVDLTPLPSGMVQGSLEVMDLAELTQVIASGGKNGRLILALPDGLGTLAFEAGRVVHAEYRASVGEPAFAAIFTAADADVSCRFCFLPRTLSEQPRTICTIDKTVDRLLLSIGAAIDQKR